ncbi:MAG: hypothetical protein N2442_13270, partial [Spirochaetes bacterium]|nr:hypothetical protein [Spirochaetota bacterium]
MQRFWVLFLWLLWFGIGCSKDVPVEGVPFFDPEGKRISLFVTSPGLKEGTFLLEKGETREVKFVPPLTLEAGSNRVRLKIAKLKGRIWIEFFGSNKRYSLELPTPLSGGGYFTFELPPSSYRGFRIRGQEGQESREVVFQEGRIGNFPLQTRFEEGRFVEIASFVIPENVDKTTVVLKLTSGTDSSPLKGVHFRLMNKGSLPSSSIRATFFGLGKERRTIFIRTRPVQEDVFVYDKWLGFT